MPQHALTQLRVIKTGSSIYCPRYHHSDHPSRLTRIRPVVVCPEMSSPAQSLASVMKVPSNSCLFWRFAFCSFCFGSFGPSSGSLRQHRKAAARHSSTMSRPARKVKMLERRKHHHFRTLRQSSISEIDDSVVVSIACVTQSDIPSVVVILTHVN